MKKITPFLWFNGLAEEAFNFYINVLEGDSKIISLNKTQENKVFTGVAKLYNQEFMFMNVESNFKFNPSISFTIELTDEKFIEKVFKTFAEDGEILMPLDKYPFSDKYGWVNDKYGVSWQISKSDNNKKITPSLLFTGKQNGKTEEALNFYTSIFDNSKIEMISRYKEGEGDVAGNINYSLFTLNGQEFTAMESSLNHLFSFNESISLFVKCKNQEEVDFFWEKFIENDGEESMCGWLKDKYGVSWQIIPSILEDLLYDKNKEKSDKAMQAMLKMKKIDINKIKEAISEK